MSKWIVLSPERHGEMRQIPREGYRFAAEQVITRVLLAELGRLLPHYVLGFIHDETTGYTPVALLGLGEQNLYVAPSGKWLGSYVPALLRGYPYGLAPTSFGEGQKVLAIEASYLSNTEGELLFDEEGKPGEHVSSTLDFLSQCERDRERTARAAQVLEKTGVIRPWPLQIARDEEKPLEVQGLYRIDGAALGRLDDATYALLRGAPMGLAHAQLFSMDQLEQLTQRARMMIEHGLRQPARAILDDLFDDADGELTFDFGS